MKRCPHADIAFCPLYHAAHYPGGLGCDDGKLAAGSCAVARGLSYKNSIAKLNRAFVDKLKRLAAEAESATQQERNRRAAGLR